MTSDESSHRGPFIVALDFPTQEAALELLAKLDPQRCRVKIGKELFTRAGPVFVRQVIDAGYDVFLDLKFHDIPNTVARACAAAADMGVWMLNVHALGGAQMMRAAADALANYERPPLLIAVTILTSMDQDDLSEVGLRGSPRDAVLRLANLANSVHLDGLVCSPLEVSDIRAQLGDRLKLVTPGVRPAGSESGDQKRVMTPREALLAGANYLVIGRPITQADNPSQALLTLQQEIADIR